MESARLLNIGEVASKLNVSKATIYQWVHLRRIPHTKLGRLLRFNEDTIDRWVAAQEAKII